MADKKLEKALYGPSLTEVALGALLGLICGVLAACLYLVFRPVVKVKELPKEPSKTVVYYIPGSENSSKSRGWQAKEKQLEAGKTVSVVEDELNAWAATLSAPPAPKPAAKPKAGAKPEDKKAPAPEGFIIPGALNFKIVGDKLQVGLVCTLNWYGLTYDTTVVATGVFEHSGDEFKFKAQKFYLGSCPLNLLPVLSNLLASNLESKQKISDELRVALTKLTAVTIENGTLKLAVQ